MRSGDEGGCDAWNKETRLGSGIVTGVMQEKVHWEIQSMTNNIEGVQETQH